MDERAAQVVIAQTGHADMLGEAPQGRAGVGDVAGLAPACEHEVTVILSPAQAKYIRRLSAEREGDGVVVLRIFDVPRTLRRVGVVEVDIAPFQG